MGGVSPPHPLSSGGSASAGTSSSSPRRSKPNSPPATPRQSEDAPTPHDGDYFLDVADLPTPAAVRRPVDYALKTRDPSDIRALSTLDFRVASLPEQVALFAAMVDGGAADQEWMLQRLQENPVEAEAILLGLAGQGLQSSRASMSRPSPTPPKATLRPTFFRVATVEPSGRNPTAAPNLLPRFVSTFGGGYRDRLFALLPSLCARADTAANVVVALSQHDSREHRLAVHHVFDAVRRKGRLTATLTRLRQVNNPTQVQNELVAQAQPTIRPIIVCHRGGLVDPAPENTVAALDAAVKAGVAENVEIDVTITVDNRLILAHGSLPFFRSRWTDLPTRLTSKISTFDQYATYLQAHPEVKRVVLDLKLPDGSPDGQDRLLKHLKRAVARYGLADRIMFTPGNQKLFEKIKATFGPRVPVSYDIGLAIGFPQASSYNLVERAQSNHANLITIGASPLAFNDGDEVLRRVVLGARGKLNKGKERPELLVWTIDDELLARELIASGVNIITTNKPWLMKRLVEAYWPHDST